MNLVVSGCSFTYWIYKTWPDYIVDQLPKLNLELHQLGHPGAGNYYIRRSVIDYINKNNLNSSNTIVMVMWSGISRRDVETSQLFAKLASTDKVNLKNINDTSFYSSGGELGNWKNISITEDYFESLYKMTDQRIHLSDTLDNITMLEYFLKVRNIKYFFMSYTDNFLSKSEWDGDDYTAHYCNPAFNFDTLINENWIFGNEAQNSLNTIARNANMLSEDGFHPSTEAHELFAKAISSEIEKKL